MVVFRLRRRSSRIHAGFLVSDATLSCCQPFVFVYRTFTLFGVFFQKTSTDGRLCVCTVGLFPVRSPLLRESMFLSFPPGTEMFQFPGYPLVTLWIHVTMTGSSPAGLLHSETCGYVFCNKPQLSPARVLLRRHVPRHPPRALLDLTGNIFHDSVFKVQVFLKRKKTFMKREWL